MRECDAATLVTNAPPSVESFGYKAMYALVPLVISEHAMVQQLMMMLFCAEARVIILCLILLGPFKK